MFRVMAGMGLALVALAANAEAPVALDSTAWETVEGDWTWSESEVSVDAGSGTALLWAKDITLHDFELTYEFQAGAGKSGVAFRAHRSAEFAKAESGKPLLGEDVYGMGVSTSDKKVHLAWSDGKIHDSAHTGPIEGIDESWTKVLIRGVGAKIEATLDDQKVAISEETDAFIAGGLALFAEGGSAKFRKVTLTDLGRNGSWTPLFNGTDFTGWKQWGSEQWDIEDGVIYGRSGPKKSEGYLATEKTWKDFHVRGAFQMLGEGNFGLFYHSTIKLREDDGYPLISGVQGEVEPGYPSSTGWLYESYKRGWLVEPPKNTLAAHVLRPEGWNEIEIQSSGKVVTTWVNGVRALHFDDPKPLLTEGSFALQLHAGGVDGIAWKDLYVEE